MLLLLLTNALLPPSNYRVKLPHHPTPSPPKSNLTFYCEANEAIRALIAQHVGGKRITLCIYSGDTAALPPNELEVLMKRLSAETPCSLEAMRLFQPLPHPHLPHPPQRINISAARLSTVTMNFHLAVLMRRPTLCTTQRLLSSSW